MRECNNIIITGLLVSILFCLGQDLGLVEYDKIDEASGLASSKNNPQLVWTHNDSGDLARIYGVGLDGSHLGQLRLSGAIALDWEDMCIGPGPDKGVDYIYIGDIGDNFANRKKKRIHRLREPIIELVKGDSPFDIKIKDFETIVFKYPDSNRDAEALMIDPTTRDIYVLSKRESSVSVYRLPFPQSTTSVIMAEKVGSLTISPEESYRSSDQITSADISRDGQMILIKTYYDVILINNSKNDVLSSILSSDQTKLDYERRSGGEAVCWRWDQKGYYTIPEESRNIPAHLYYYPFPK